MSACERCWADAGRAELMTGEDQATAYRRMLGERGVAGVCTPAEQAGTEATICRACGRRTAHQHTGECMACHHENRPRASAEPPPKEEG